MKRNARLTAFWRRALAVAPLTAAALLTAMQTSCIVCEATNPGDCDADLYSTFEVYTMTTGANLDGDGYTVTMDETSRTIGVNDSTEFTRLAREAQHTLSLGGVAENCEVRDETRDGSNQRNPRRIVLGKDRFGSSNRYRSDHWFQVICQGQGPLYVTTVTTGIDLDADGYAVELSGENEFTTAAVPANGRTAVRLQNPGYQGLKPVALTGVASHCSVRPPNPQFVLIEANKSASMTFEVVCGRSELTVTILTTGFDLDANGYSLTLDGDSRRVAVIDTVSYPGLSSGLHVLRLGDIAANCTAVGDIQRAVTLPTSGTTSVGFVVVCSRESPTVVFRDDFESGTRFVSSVVSASGSTSNSERSEPTGGNPGAFRWMKHDISGPSQITVLHMFNTGSYDPAVSGPISHIDHEEDRKLIDQETPGTLESAFVLQQNGVTYRLNLGNITSRFWERIQRLNLRPADFFPAGLDFSRNGGVIRFGYSRASTTTEMYGGDMEHGIDNWRVEVHR